MKNQMYITLLILPLLATGCGGRKETAQTMPVPEISVARPTVQNITLTKEYPGYLTSEKTVDLVGRVSGTLQTIAYPKPIHTAHTSMTGIGMRMGNPIVVRVNH